MFIQNNTKTPMDGIWATPGIDITSGGHFGFDEAFSGTNHHCLWNNLTHSMAFVHNKPPLVRPSMRRLHCREPRLVHCSFEQVNVLQ